MVTKKFKIFWIATRRYHRYFIALLVMFLVFFVGGNYELTEEEKTINSYRDAVINHESGTYLINSNSLQEKIDFKSVVAKGQHYHLLFDYKSINRDDNPVSNINIYLENSFGERQNIGKLGINNNEKILTYDHVFQSGDSLDRIVFEKESEYDKSLITISDFSLLPINCRNSSCFSDLADSKLGKNIDRYVDQSMDRKNDIIYSYNFGGAVFGQVFKANSDNLAGVDFAIKKKGNGGRGVYQLQIREVSESDAGYVVSEDNFANYNFFIENLEKYHTEQNVYHFPLAARIEKGKLYFIGLSNMSAKHNYFNTLELVGSSADFYKEGSGILLGSDKKYGDLYFKTYTLDLHDDAGNTLINGRNIDLGSSNVYHFSLSDPISNYLDIYEDGSKDIVGSYVYSDSLFGGISATARNNNFFTYKINTNSPIKNFRAEIIPQKNNFQDLLTYYSFDNQNWELALDSKTTKKDLYLNLAGRGIDVIYLKFTYSEPLVRGKEEVFGLEKLKIVADFDF